MFDRFILEEQFGAMVYEALPHALVVLETQDLHFVRRARQELKEKWLGLEGIPPNFYHTETALRETASLERVDFSFVVSSFEEQLLDREFSLGLDRQRWIPFSFDPIQSEKRSGDFESRSDFVWIGNFRHAPNADALRWTRSEIWPEIRAKIPSAVFHVFGAYPSQEFMDWNRDPSAGIKVHGHAETLEQVFLTARVNLAPLRFGAGVKGKILEGFRYGVPVVTTPVGAEGLLPPTRSELEFPGEVEVGPKALAEAAIRLYQDRSRWSQAQMRALALASIKASAKLRRTGL
jgi:glycosyltransferase involved in cell wall biosynthesis